jgi:hypothetical protein
MFETAPIEEVISDEEFVAAWHSNKTVRELAEEFELPQECIQHEWRRLRFEGLLPTAKRRLVTRGRVWPGENYDGRPSLMEHDPLLERLIQVHGKPAD